MASNIANIWADVLSTLQGVDELAHVDDWPLDAETWVDQYIASEGLLPAAHLGARQESEPAYRTCGSLGEILPLRVTLIYTSNGPDATGRYGLRDAVIAAMENDQSCGGYAEIVNTMATAIDRQEEFTTVMHIDFDIQHEWSPA